MSGQQHNTVALYPGPPQIQQAAGWSLSLLALPVLSASAMSLGANLAAVRTGSIRLRTALLDAAAKGIAAVVIVQAASRLPAQHPVTLAMLFGAGYAINSLTRVSGLHPANCSAQQSDGTAQ
ncbi:MAG: hypothetical protein ACOX4Z_06415 [Desulfobulbus sp.]|jgi:hypothetical protein